jgi:hypothetical protein
MQFRIGINQGDIVFDDALVYGDGVNVAARLESIAEPGGICISEKVHHEIRGKIDLRYHDIGFQKLKNINKPVRVYRVDLALLISMPSPGLRYRCPISPPSRYSRLRAFLPTRSKNTSATALPTTSLPICPASQNSSSSLEIQASSSKQGCGHQADRPGAWAVAMNFLALGPIVPRP